MLGALNSDFFYRIGKDMLISIHKFPVKYFVFISLKPSPRNGPGQGGDHAGTEDTEEERIKNRHRGHREFFILKNMLSLCPLCLHGK
ncbi:MAG: hypothetical protein B6I22_10335 [Desulfobacteraceae bacterium 4572_123]|nr:MAG: hypothetical protein B6I22_10335 [Desulfobacteraceae bacterium 4572_123]